MNKSQLEDDVFYGEHAQALTTNPAYQAAIARMQAKLFEQFGSTGIFQRRKREELWKMQRLFNSFQQELEVMLQDAALARSDIERAEKSK